MTPYQQMEQFSLAYIKAVAADAGYQVTRPAVDTDSVDGVLMADAGRRPRIDFQAKSTSQDVLGENELRFTLPIKNYEDLRADTLTPRILIVLLMPQQFDEWTSQSHDELCLRRCAYWLCLQGQQATRNISSVTVELPTANMFNAAQLQELMQKTERGESLC
ncbi:MAG: DUF4365 domain-containing protein [Chloroflexi bacterium]|nr:DUF4365 domain-containing protein [Chloroflexota bacterium]